MTLNRSAEPQYAFQNPSLPVTIPSVFHDPRSHMSQVPAVAEQRNDTGHVTAQSQALSMSAPVMGMGDWMSQSLVSMNVLEHIPPITRTLKKPRQQFTACTACRTRRVKCDLKDIRLEWEKLHKGDNLETRQTLEIAENEKRDGSCTPDVKKKKAKSTPTEKPNLIAIGKKEDVPCTNCYTRETTCIDEFAYRKRNKGKRPIHDSTTRKRSHDLFEEGSHASQYMYSVDPGSTQLANAQLNLQIPAHTETQESTTLRPGLPRLWSGTSEPADLYGFRGLTHDLGLPTPVDPAHELTESLELRMMPPDGKLVPETSLEPWVASHQNLLAFEPQQTSSNISPAATDYDSRDLMLTTDYRHVYCNLASAAPSTPKSVSSRGPSKATALDSQNSLQDFRIPDLTPSFFESDFYRRFHIQRPLIDAINFGNRYKSAYPHSAVTMGLAGGILCHVLYAWACSYGIDQSGQPLVQSQEWYIPEGTVHPDRQQQYSIRESARQRQLEQTNLAVRRVLQEIDQAGILRSISWDGARCLLLILPLTELQKDRMMRDPLIYYLPDISSAAERLAMYECALGQVFSLCSDSALGYDGLPVIPRPEQELMRRRLYWYAFVHEGITTGLKGGRMVLDEDDLSSLDDMLPQTTRLALTSSRTYQSVAKFASAPIRLAIACRLVHKALTGTKARRSERVDRQLLSDAWEALEESWIEFESIKSFSPGPLTRQDDVVRFADGWKIFMFEAHNVIRESLEHRAHILIENRASAQLMDLSIAQTQPHSRDQNILEIQHLRSIARAKCDHILREIVGIVKRHVNTNFFEWDASLVRDGTYYAAMLLAERSGSDNDISCCLEALSEMRWAFARTQERSREPLSIYSLEPGVPNIASINNAESDLLAGAMEDQGHTDQHMDGDQKPQTQLHQPQNQQPPYFAPINPTSTNPIQAIPGTTGGTRAVNQYPGWAQTLANQRPEQSDKLTGWTNQPGQHDPNQMVTGNVYFWPPSHQ
ncbi:hypothetical protein QFC21_000277 [Naganishia friedmannii]|uniref:Uncharacterized protein n=1 Tax=Naganishia friedmannii TaxID=89922 RepID=A0ACC2WB10_9TREE|nr:hypothetical protein QFC21_000277 [Naganishia friedmannii]